MAQGGSGGQGGAAPKRIQPVIAPIEVWIADGEQRLVGREPPPVLATVIQQMILSVAESGTPESQDVHLPADATAGPRTLQVRARPLPGAGIMIASFAIDAVREAEDDLLRYDR